MLNFKTERTSNRNIHDFELILKLIISEVEPTFYCILLQSCLFYQLSSSPPWHSSQAIVQPLAVSNRRGIDQCISQSAAWEQQSDWKSQSNNNYSCKKKISIFSNNLLWVNVGFEMSVCNPDKSQNMCNRKCKLLHDFWKIEMLNLKSKALDSTIESALICKFF